MEALIKANLIVIITLFSSCIVEYKNDKEIKPKVEEIILQQIKDDIEKDCKLNISGNNIHIDIFFDFLPEKSYLFYIGSYTSMLILNELVKENDLDTLEFKLINKEKKDTLNLSYKIADLTYVNSYYNKEIESFIKNYFLRDWDYIKETLDEGDSLTLDMLMNLRKEFDSIETSSIKGFYFYEKKFMVIVEIVNKNNESFFLTFVYSRSSNKVLEIGVNDFSGLR